MPSLEVIRGTESQQRQIVSEAAGRTAKLQQGSFAKKKGFQLAHNVERKTYWRRCYVMTSFRRRYDVSSTSFACWG